MNETQYKEFRAKQAEERRQEWVRQCRWQDTEIKAHWRLTFGPTTRAERLRMFRNKN